MTMDISGTCRQWLCSCLFLLFPSVLSGAEISVSPPEVIISNEGRNKAFIEIVNHSGEDYMYRTGMLSGTTNNYIVYPPVGLVKSEDKTQLGVIALGGAKADEDTDYIFIHFIPRKKNAPGRYEVPLNLTMQIKVKKKGGG